MSEKLYKRGRLSDFFENNIVFRELEPVNKNLPGFSTLRGKLGLSVLPRKKDKEYVKVLSEMFRATGNFSKIIYIGDTLMSDLSVINNFAESGLFKTMGIITREGEVDGFEENENYIFSGSWANLPNALACIENKFFSVDKRTVVIIDIDKTAIGARGKNEKAIDRARMDAIFMLAKMAFKDISLGEFLSVYNEVNKREFFSITEDNQDFISILSMLVYGGALSLAGLRSAQSILSILMRVKTENPVLSEYAETVLQNVKMQNPTAFPQFRKAEFEKTIARMDFMQDKTPVETLLSEEIMITGEVYDTALDLKNRGALVFGVSDKPALSSIPQDGSTLPPIYEKEMKIYGGKSERI